MILARQGSGIGLYILLRTMVVCSGSMGAGSRGIWKGCVGRCTGRVHVRCVSGRLVPGFTAVTIGVRILVGS